jgi:hypothetical protein
MPSELERCARELERRRRSWNDALRSVNDAIGVGTIRTRTETMRWATGTIGRGTLTREYPVGTLQSRIVTLHRLVAIAAKFAQLAIL